MAPLQIIETNDTFATMTRFETSAVYEMIISLYTLLRPSRRAAWANQVRNKMSREFWDELNAVYEPFQSGLEFFELPVDYPYHTDVPGFIQYVRDMDNISFVFYLIGRRIPPERIAETNLDINALIEAIETGFGNYCDAERQANLADVLKDVDSFKNRLTNLWQWYWDGYFGEFEESLHAQWESGLAEAERIMTNRGSNALFEHLLGWKLEKLPSPLPPDQPYHEIVLVPSSLTPRRVFMFFGYGNITVVYDSEHTEARVAQLEDSKEEAINTARALGDNTRMKILKLIAHHEGKINGKGIAKSLDLSASVVSRHLAQLRDGGLIIEEPRDNRTITYRLQKDTLTTLADKVMDYLYS
jgi:DNA-binding transcriptional ArsR family regulator